MGYDKNILEQYSDVFFSRLDVSTQVLMFQLPFENPYRAHPAKRKGRQNDLNKTSNPGYLSQFDYRETAITFS